MIRLSVRWQTVAALQTVDNDVLRYGLIMATAQSASTVPRRYTSAEHDD